MKIFQVKTCQNSGQLESRIGWEQKLLRCFPEASTRTWQLRMQCPCRGVAKGTALNLEDETVPSLLLHALAAKVHCICEQFPACG